MSIIFIYIVRFKIYFSLLLLFGKINIFQDRCFFETNSSRKLHTRYKNVISASFLLETTKEQ